ncbi:hypothetical protein ASPWEDRAFT_170108 [Aspergillus wentii DTO 134E9]|uniref:G domain-containing protein n=1 Tax=Aspergillus wentii DTO 134E9 TaxID=1073089 RepID=A0A1L9RNT4_ASPWE|nr:uncharacterized protein ASPWEDRAFT_170108 [Aspergillus wentii DTO 134E9]OJJ36596.1 hypothetical protein ASPWEDRAFT_170108 [Aspergillus wentii DTO 134E9]
MGTNTTTTTAMDMDVDTNTDNQTMHNAQIHFIAEQTALHARSYEGQGVKPTLPDLKNHWFSLPATRVEDYCERVRFLDGRFAAAGLAGTGTGDGGVGDDESGSRYRGFLDKIYQKLFGGLERGVLGGLVVSVDDFKNQVIQLDEDELVKSVLQGVTALEKLRTAFERINTTTPLSETDWQKEISETLKLATTDRVIIGVVGSTGAGKSSLINAVADEEGVLATNCMRASTAVATEISYNHSSPRRYKAEVAFISREEWERELQVLFRNVVRDDVAKDSDAAVALDKIRAVYPFLGGRDILGSSVEELLGHASVAGLLGSTLSIEEDDAKIFSKKLKSYIDSKTKRRGTKGKAKSTASIPDQPDSNMGLWPLIRVVRIYVKAAALATGAVLVDLPGVFDSNAARVAVAEDYMKQCSAHWVVAPINRAVDDKVARDLLNKNFKMQMHMDGAFSNITFICTKTDDISVGEVQDSLRLESTATDAREELEEMCEVVEDELKNLHNELAFVTKDEEDVNDEIGYLDYADPSSDSSESPLKRKRQEQQKCPLGLHQAENNQPEKEVPELQEQRLDQQRLGLLARRKQLSSKHRALSQQVKLKKDELEKLQQEIESAEANVLRDCIEARNSYSKKEIKRDFARGIRDLDAEFEDDEVDFHQGEGESSSRDYKELEKGLPVFCVSIRAYQKLQGRLAQETAVAGFTAIEETEIPFLQAHCIALTEKAREASAIRFLTRFGQLLQSLSLWATRADPALILTDEMKKQLEGGFNETIAQMISGMDNLKDALFTQLRQSLDTTVVSRLDVAAKYACDHCEKVVSIWNKPAVEGGVRFNTYRAICNRSGSFYTADWNQDLANPMRHRMMNAWRGNFYYQVPGQIDAFIANINRQLYAFHQAAIASAGGTISTQNVEKLNGILNSTCSNVEQEFKQISTGVRRASKDINRGFASVIAAEMTPIYRECALQTGKGTLSRVRNIMSQGTADNRTQIFSHVVQHIQEHLMTLMTNLEGMIKDCLTTSAGYMSRDYYAAIIAPQVYGYSQALNGVKDEVTLIVQEAARELGLGIVWEREGEGNGENKNGEEKTEGGVTVKEEPV